MMNETEKKAGGLVGIISNKTHILAWNYDNGLNICVTGDQTSPDVWQVRVECGNSIRLLGSVFGGRWQTDRLIRALRNGMTSRRLRLKKIRSNKAKESK